MATVVAIDGPAGAGKSTVAKRVAAALGLRYVDTGAMYRAIGLAIAQADDPEAALLDAGAVAQAAQLELSWDGAQQYFRIWLDGSEVTEAVRTAAAAMWASRVAAIPSVRDVLVARQRVLAAPGAVLEGRDIGSVVFPDTPHKFFLDADLAIRSQRRQGEHGGDAGEAQRQVAERDRRDLTRSTAPLRPAPGATVIDTSGLTVDQVVALVLARIRGAHGPG